MGQIELRGLKFKAYHGYYDEERREGNNFEVDIILRLDFSDASVTDDLRHTVDYQEIYALVAMHMKQPSYLLEHVTDKILEAIRDGFPAVSYAEVKVHKLNPPIGGPCQAAVVSNSFTR